MIDIRISHRAAKCKLDACARWLFASPGLAGLASDYDDSLIFYSYCRNHIISMASFLFCFWCHGFSFLLLVYGQMPLFPKQISLISNVVIACEHIFRTGGATPLNMGSSGGRQDRNTYNTWSIYRWVSVLLAWTFHHNDSKWSEICHFISFWLWRVLRVLLLPSVGWSYERWTSCSVNWVDLMALKWRFSLIAPIFSFTASDHISVIIPFTAQTKRIFVSIRHWHTVRSN